MLKHNQKKYKLNIECWFDVFVVAEVEETLGLFDEDDDKGDGDDAESRVTMRTPTWNDDRISNYT